MNDCDLANRDCVPCRGGVPPLAGEALESLQRMLANGGTVIDGHQLEKRYRFEDFRSALELMRVQAWRTSARVRPRVRGHRHNRE